MYFLLIVVSFIVFTIGSLGVIWSHRHLILILISIELLILAINIIFIISSIYIDDIMGQVYTIFILTVAAADTSIGLALLIVYYRLRGTIAINLITLLKA